MNLHTFCVLLVRRAAHENKAKELGDRLDRIIDPHVRISLRLQVAFSLRLEESIKFQPRYADRGGHRHQGFMGQGRARPDRADHETKNSVRCWTKHTGWWARIADPGAQDLHQAAALPTSVNARRQA